MPDNPKGANGETVQYSKDGGDVWWSCGADDHLSIAFALSLGAQEISKGKKPAAVHVSHGEDLDGKTLSWGFLCLPLGTGTFPVYAQLFQGTPPNVAPISQLYQYDAKVNPPPQATFDDSVVLEEGA